MTDGDFTLAGLPGLAAMLGREVPAVVDTLLGELDRAFAELATALERGDLAGVAGAAHAARNSALMIDARPLLEGLGELERAARAGDLVATSRADAEVAGRWDALRAQLVGAAAGPPGEPPRR